MKGLSDFLINDFRATKKNFNRILSIGMLFAVFGLFYIIEPYFSYKVEEPEILKLLKEGEAKKDMLINQINKLKKNQQKFDDELTMISEDIQKFPDHLASALVHIRSMFIRSTTLEVSRPTYTSRTGQTHLISPTESDRSIGRVIFPQTITSFKDGVQFYIKEWFDKKVRDIKELVIQPLSRLNEKTGPNKTNKLNLLCDNATKKIVEYIKTVEPDFWHSYDEGKKPVARKLDEILNESLRPVYQEIEAMLKVITNSKKKQEDELLNAKNSIDKIRKDKTKLEARLKDLESPIGKIPLSLTDFIEVFPLIIITFVLMLTYYCHKSIKIIDLLLNQEKLEMDKDGKDLKYFADCWYLPPFKSFIQPLSLAILFILIFAIFLRSVMLITSKSGMFLTFLGDQASFKKVIFNSIYFMGAFLIIGALWFIFYQIKKIKGNAH